MAKSDSSALVRSFGRMDLIAVTINAVIGAGIFGLPAKIFGLVGDFSVVAFLACAVFASLIVICFAEVASRFHDTGGPYLYARKTFGPLIGFEVGWLMWLARVSAFAANSNLLVSYAAYFWPVIGARRRAEYLSLFSSIGADGDQYRWSPQCRASQQPLCRRKANPDCAVYLCRTLVCRLGTFYFCHDTRLSAVFQFRAVARVRLYRL